MKKTKSCGNDREKMGRKGKGKGYVEIEIKMGKMPKKKARK
jgi:hypothetical protein